MSLDQDGSSRNNPVYPHVSSSSPLKDLESGVSGREDGFVDLSRRSSESLHSAPSDSLELLDYGSPDAGLLGQTGPSTSSRRKGCWGSCAAWLSGPQPPRQYRIEPFFPRFQTAPLRLVDRFLPTRSSRVWALVAFHALWALIFLSILHRSVTGPDIPGYGSPVRLSCGAQLWSNSTNCGLNGDECRPFDDASFAFRCPAGCRQTILLEPYTVGDQDYNYRPLVIGGAADAEGDGIYRGDSFLCAAALHAGAINDQTGGCGILRRTGEQSNYASVEKNGISSIPFPSNFPLSLTFERGPIAACRDPRWLLFAISVFFTAVLSLATTSPAVFYSSVFFITYFQVALASDPPFSPDYNEVVSIGLGRFLPAAFVGFAIYYFCVRRTLTGLTAQWEKTVLWLGGCWVGALNTDTFDRIPISRLTPHDIQQQPGAVPALIIIVAILVVALLSQAWALCIEGRLPQYLLLYGVMACAGPAHPSLHPGAALSAGDGAADAAQSAVPGIASGAVHQRHRTLGVRQHPADASRAARGSPAGQSTTQHRRASHQRKQQHHFFLPMLPDDVAGISVLVNDVERFRAYRENESESDAATPFHWTRLRANETEFFRFGYFKTRDLGGIWYEDFTKAGTWLADGSWVHMAPGASR
ncbi:hypothetical protein T310_6901 [Rasamsonia emersonii CBS 393.64]|uniref:LCCL domain-containing protein n=1 Tax=Rasamsonia emersonii (strain ATCC 16479 / CBS 393.64 / IMI 116815) TaxID=1408163 RepID=A0A0F4YLJ2_RASE3|nr:hypothetical protein T310_6901 [Rasamsonia emersonii CBS 393.64]KKA19137.1 hypothetical protein T310_6901 [Rasamsonia emersonii CBS 393.64]